MQTEAGQEPNNSGQEPQNPQGAASGAPTASGPSAGQEPAGRSMADMEREIAELRRENAKHRTENRTLQEFKAQQEAATLSETEKMTKAKTEAEARATTREAQLKETRLRADIEKAARKLNIQDEDAAYRLLDLDAVEYDADGKPANVEALLASLAKSKTYLVTPSGSAGSPANPNRGGAPVFTTTQIRDRQFYVANRAAIEQAAKEGRIVEG